MQYISNAAHGIVTWAYVRRPVSKEIFARMILAFRLDSHHAYPVVESSEASPIYLHGYQCFYFRALLSDQMVALRL